MYTDLQSLRFLNENNKVDAEKYQDKAGMLGEPDTRDLSDLPKENAANLAGFNGDKASYETIQFPHELSPEWAGAPAIILHHFCGVAV